MAGPIAHAPPPPRRPYGGTTTPPNPITNAAQQIQFQQELARRARSAVDRQAGSPTGGPGKPLTLPHDWTGFDNTFAPQAPGAVDARHPNIQSVTNPPPTTGQVAANAAAPKLDVNSPAVQTALNNVPGTVNPDAAAAAQIAQARSTGMPAQTPYGSIGGNWQQEVMAKHPAIGVKGSQANVDFVNAYKAAQANQPQGPGVAPVDPHQIAQNVMDNIAKPAASPTAPTAGIAAINPDISAPTGMGGPKAPVNFAGQNVGPADWTPPNMVAQAQKEQQQSGQSTGAGIRDFLTSPEGQEAKQKIAPFVDTALGVASGGIIPSTQGVIAGAQQIPDALSNAYNYAKGAFHGFIHGSQSGSDSPPDPTQTPSFNPSSVMSSPLTQPMGSQSAPLSLSTGVTPPPPLTPASSSSQTSNTGQ